MIKATIAVLCVQIAAGGYVTRLQELDHCKDPVPPYVDKPIAEDHLTLVQKDNRTLVSGNITYYETCNNCRWTVSVVKESKGRKRHILRCKDMNCRHILIQLMHTLAGVPFDIKTCSTKPGTYDFKEFDINQVEQKIRLPFRNNGIYTYTYTLFTEKGTQFCWKAKVSITL